MHKGRKARLIAWQMNPKIKFIQTYNKFIDGSELKSFLARCYASRSKQNAEIGAVLCKAQQTKCRRQQSKLTACRGKHKDIPQEAE